MNPVISPSIGEGNGQILLPQGEWCLGSGSGPPPYQSHHAAAAVPTELQPWGLSRMSPHPLQDSVPCPKSQDFLVLPQELQSPRLDAQNLSYITKF